MSSYAKAWEKWYPTIEQGTAALSVRMVELAQISAKQKVLDIGTGFGQPALTAARCLGPGGSVVAIDHDPNMLAIGRRHARGEGLSNIEFKEMRAEQLSFPPESFDAVLCRWSLMFVADVSSVLSVIRDVLRPGGRFVAVIWGVPERVPSLSLARRVVHAHLGLPPPSDGPMTAFALSDVVGFERQLDAAGFESIRGEWIPVTYDYDSPEAYVQNRIDCTGPLFEGLDSVSEDDRRLALDAVNRSLEPFRLKDGSVRLENLAYCTAARAPE